MLVYVCDRFIYHIVKSGSDVSIFFIFSWIMKLNEIFLTLVGECGLHHIKQEIRFSPSRVAWEASVGMNGHSVSLAPSSQVILSELYSTGFQRSFSDDDDLTAIADSDVVYAFQAPPLYSRGGSTASHSGNHWNDTDFSSVGSILLISSFSHFQPPSVLLMNLIFNSYWFTPTVLCCQWLLML